MIRLFRSGSKTAKRFPDPVWRRGVCQAKEKAWDRRSGQVRDFGIRQAFGGAGGDDQVDPAEIQGGNPEHADTADFKPARKGLRGPSVGRPAAGPDEGAVVGYQAKADLEGPEGEVALSRPRGPLH